jgi:hypothetical protein
MTTNPDARHRRHPTPFREDRPDMFHIEFRFAEAEERQARFRAEAERERHGRFGRRRFRHRVGASIVRIGQQVGGDAMSDALSDPITSPAWQG